MRQMMLIDCDTENWSRVKAGLDAHNISLLTAHQGRQGLALLRSQRVALVLCELRLPDMSGLDVLAEIKRHQSPPPVVVVASKGTIRDAVRAMRLGAADFFPKPVTTDDVRIVAEMVASPASRETASRTGSRSPTFEAHAASRWARAVAPIAYAERDPRTTEGWSRQVYASPGALRNWCRTAGVPPRCSLRFGRLLRAVYLCRDHEQKPENVLDIADLRTLSKLLRSAGLTPGAELPRTIKEFLASQRLITDSLLLREIAAALARCPPESSAGAPCDARSWS